MPLGQLQQPYSGYRRFFQRESEFGVKKTHSFSTC